MVEFATRDTNYTLHCNLFKILKSQSQKKKKNPKILNAKTVLQHVFSSNFITIVNYFNFLDKLSLSIKQELVKKIIENINWFKPILKLRYKVISPSRHIIFHQFFFFFPWNIKSTINSSPNSFWPLILNYNSYLF